MLSDHFKIVTLLQEICSKIRFEGIPNSTTYIAGNYILSSIAYDFDTESNTTISIYNTSDLKVLYSLRFVDCSKSTACFSYINVAANTATTCNISECDSFTILGSMGSRMDKLPFDMGIDLNLNLEEKSFQLSTIHSDEVLFPYMLLSHLKTHAESGLSDVTFNFKDIPAGDLERIIYDLEIEKEKYQ